MTYQVLARKWRPQTFDAVVGQEAITRTLRNALVSGRIAHAYLLAGPRGVGKTTTARLLARALLCAERKDGPEACGTCVICVDPNPVDIIEIDGASNRGIDEIRTLRDNVKYAPARGRYKVYIIDEVHQLTEPAFNALLKTLEEPPAHIVFVLATTDPRDIPATVLSRVQRFDFRPITPDALATSLERILREEQVDFDPAALPSVVRAAEGSLRDALSLLDTAIAYGNGRLDAEATAGLLGTTAPAEVRAFATALVAHDTAGALEAVDRATREGEDLLAFARDVIELLRRALVLKAAPSAKLADLTHSEGNELRALGETTSLDELLYVLRAFLDADVEMRESPHPRVELEVAAVRATRRPVPQAIDALLRRLEEAETALRGQAVRPTGSAPSATLGLPLDEPLRVEPVRTGRGEPPRAAAPRDDRARAPAPRTEPPSPETHTEPGAPRGNGTASAELSAAWQRVVDDVLKKKPMLGAVLAQARPGGVADRTLAIVLSGNQFHREMLTDAGNRDLVVQAIQRHVPSADRFTVSGGEGGGGVTAHPAVQAALAEFQGEVVAVRPRPPEGEGQ